MDAEMKVYKKQRLNFNKMYIMLIEAGKMIISGGCMYSKRNQKMWWIFVKIFVIKIVHISLHVVHYKDQGLQKVLTSLLIVFSLCIHNSDHGYCYGNLNAFMSWKVIKQPKRLYKIV